MEGTQHGFVYVEYLIALLLFGLPCSYLTLRVGPALVRAHTYAEMVLSGPVP